MSEDKKAIVANCIGTLSGEETDGRFIHNLTDKSMREIHIKSVQNSPIHLFQNFYNRITDYLLIQGGQEIESTMKEYGDTRKEAHNYLLNNLDQDPSEVKKRLEGYLQDLEGVQSDMIEAYNQLFFSRLDPEFIEKYVESYVEDREVTNSFRGRMLEVLAELEQQGHYVGIITPSYTKKVEKVFSKLGYDKELQNIYGSEITRSEGSEGKSGFTHIGSEEKKEFLERIIQESGVDREGVVSIVDDFLELPLIENSGTSFLSPYSLEKKGEVGEALCELYDLKKLHKPEDLPEELRIIG